MCDPCTPDALLEAIRALRVAEPDLGFKPLLAKLRAQQPDLGAATKEVRVALAALKAESEAARAATAAPPAAVEGGMPPNAALSSMKARFDAVYYANNASVGDPALRCCCRSLASSGLKPRSGSATRKPRTASRRASSARGKGSRWPSCCRSRPRASYLVARPRQV